MIAALLSVVVKSSCVYPSKLAHDTTAATIFDLCGGLERANDEKSL